MKLKNKTVLSIGLAVVLVVGTTTVFATSAKPNLHQTTGVTHSAELATTYTLNGKTYHILADGTTLEESEYSPSPSIEWWTYEEYKNWLEQQKQTLPTLLGQKGKVNGKEFVWTQETIDETIAMYEKNLQDIKNGMLLSKTIDGKENVIVSINENAHTAIQTDDQIVMNNTSGAIDIKQYKPYEQYGMIYNPEEQRFYYQGKLVRKFNDQLASSGIGFSFDTGEIDINAKRNSSHVLIGLEVSSQEEFDKYTNHLKQHEKMIANAAESGFSDTLLQDVLNDYTAFGVVYNTKTGLWQYNGKDIYLFYDEQGQKLIQGNANPTNSISLETIRHTDGTINKLSMIPPEHLSSYLQKLEE